MLSLELVKSNRFFGPPNYYRHQFRINLPSELVWRSPPRLVFDVLGTSAVAIITSPKDPNGYLAPCNYTEEAPPQTWSWISNGYFLNVHAEMPADIVQTHLRDRLEKVFKALDGSAQRLGFNNINSVPYELLPDVFSEAAEFLEST